MLQHLCALARPILRPIEESLLEKRLDSRIRSVTRLVPITEFVEEDVFIVGYPKSGNTWVQNLVAGVIYGVDPEHAPDTLIQELVPDVHYKHYYKRYWTPMFFKSHHLPRPEYRRVVYLLRDGRDVMVSYFRHRTDLEGRRVDFLKMVRNGEGLFPCKWYEHVEAWLRNPYNANMTIIKYEGLKRNPIDELSKFCTFVGIERHDSFLKRIIEGCTFAKMRQKETQFGWDNTANKWSQDKFFVRRGKIGSYKDEMPPDVLEAFLLEAVESLKRCGYLTE